MITSAILYILGGVVYLVSYPLRILPDVSLPDSVGSTLSNIGSYLAAIDAVFPVSVFLVILALYLSIEGGILTYKGIMWIIRRIPGQG